MGMRRSYGLNLVPFDTGLNVKASYWVKSEGRRFETEQKLLRGSPGDSVTFTRIVSDIPSGTYTGSGVWDFIRYKSPAAPLTVVIENGELRKVSWQGNVTGGSITFPPFELVQQGDLNEEGEGKVTVTAFALPPAKDNPAKLTLGCNSMEFKFGSNLYNRINVEFDESGTLKLSMTTSNNSLQGTAKK